MSNAIKSGQHPDADQLSSFIEQALPAHERDDVLAHLSVCAECRAVVALAMPEEEEIAAPAPELRRRPWFAGWMVFVPAAAAVAALALFVFYVHRQNTAPQQQAQMSPLPAAPPASAPPPQPKAATSAPETRVVRKANPSAPSQQDRIASVVSASAGANAPAAVQHAPPQTVAVQNDAVQTAPAPSAFNSIAPAANNAVVGQNQSSQQDGASQNVFHGNAIGGPVQSNNNSQQSEANAQNRKRQNGLRQTPADRVQQQAEGQATVATESDEASTVIAGRAVTELSFTQQPLPSHLAILSSAATGPLVLAIDSRHTVFISNDAGQHWKVVRAAWKGRAVMVETASSNKMPPLQVTGANVVTFSAAPQGLMLAKKAGAKLTGTVTDRSGAVIGGASVTLTDPRTQLSRTLTTDAGGRYVAAGLDPGSYNLDVTARGFNGSHRREVAVTSNEETVANFTMDVGAATETVTVEASDSALDLKSVPKPVARRRPATVFEIVTDKGGHWVSSDGLAWRRK